MEITDEVRSRMGTATITDGTWTLTYVRHLDHPVERVWRAITESDHLAAWFPCDIVGERRSGADVDMTFWPHVLEKFELPEPNTKGHIDVWDPPTRFELWWEGDHLCFALEPTATGTTLRLTTVIEDPAIATDMAAGWHVCLDRLQVRLDSGDRGTAGGPPPGARGRVHARREGRRPMRSMATLLGANGSWTLRFERRFDHPIDKVWRAVIEPEHRDLWFPQRIVGELAPGETVRFVDDPNIPAEGFEGRCIAVEPPRLLELEWGEDRLRMELEPDGGGTRFVLLDTLAERRHAARTGAGWHLCLEGLHAEVDGSAPPPATDEATWNEVHGAYLESVGGERHVWGQMPA